MSTSPELTDAQQLLLRAMLQVLADQPAEIAEAGWHGLVEARLQVRVSLDDFNSFRDRCLMNRWVVGAAHPISKKMRWAISASGQIALQQL